MFEQTVLKIVQTINAYLSDYVLIVLLISVGVFFSIKTNWVQIRCFKDGVKKIINDFSINGKKNDRTLTSFQALMTAIASQIGTGNIIGASGAILTGGPGAVFWMWLIAFFGMATLYAETVTVINTRKVKLNGEIIGGPSYYIQKAFGKTFGAVIGKFFSFCAVLALGFFGAMIPSNSIASTFNTAFKVQPYITGIVLVIICAIIFFGGLKTLANVLEKIVPLMAFVFIFGSIIALMLKINKVPEAFMLIFKYAFQPNAIIGGGLGYAIKTAISQGVKRGLYSNEAGMGTIPHAHLYAKVERAHDQGIIAMLGVFIDTIVVLTLNSLVIITILYTKGGILEYGYNGVLVEIFDKTNLAQKAFGSVMGEGYGSAFIAICLFFFAFSTILGWNLFARINFENLIGKKYNAIFFVIALIFVFLGSISSNDLVWELQDMFDQLLVLPNVIALFILNSVVIKEIKKTTKNKSK